MSLVIALVFCSAKIKPEENIERVADILKEIAIIGKTLAEVAKSKEFSVTADAIQTLSKTVG